MSTTLTFKPLTDRGLEILDRLEKTSTPAFRTDLGTGARSYWRNAQGAPSDGYEAALEARRSGRPGAARRSVGTDS